MSNCAERVHDGYSFHGKPCARRATIHEQGVSWCAIHAPSKIKARREKKHARWAAEHAAKEAEQAARQAAHERARICADALEGVPHPEKLPELLKAIAEIVADYDPDTRLAVAYRAMMGEGP